MKMRKTFTKVLQFVLASCFLASNVFADENSVKGKLFEKYKNLPPAIIVNKTSIPSLYEVNIFGRAAYTNEKVDFLLMGGNLINLANLEDESKKRAPFLHSEFVENLPVEYAIKTVYGTGERKMYTFEDPDCGFCQMLTQTLQANADKLNVTVYTFMFPLKLHPDAPNKAKYIMCQPNPSEVWKKWMADKTGLPLNADGTLDKNAKFDCDKGEKSVNAGEKIARTLGYNSTPRLMFLDGSAEKGMVEFPRLNELLTKTKIEYENLKASKKQLNTNKK